LLTSILGIVPAKTGGAPAFPAKEPVSPRGIAIPPSRVICDPEKLISLYSGIHLHYNEYMVSYKKLYPLFPRFWGKMSAPSDNECWAWKYGTFKKRGGYGQFSYNSIPSYAHRVSWELVFGEIENGLCVLHKCDNPPCCNPNHLFLGTRADNNEDMENKGRSVKRGALGEKNINAKLTAQDITNIKRLRKTGKPRKEVAALFDVSIATISRITSNKAWKHLNNNE